MDSNKRGEDSLKRRKHINPKESEEEEKAFLAFLQDSVNDNLDIIEENSILRAENICLTEENKFLHQKNTTLKQDINKLESRIQRLQALLDKSFEGTKDEN